MPNPLPIVKWVGGKRQLQHKIVPLLKDSRIDWEKATYYEPFFGGGAILFALRPCKAVISDINKGLVNLYKHVQSDVGSLVSRLQEVESLYNSMSETEQRTFYLEERTLFNHDTEQRLGLQMAVRFLFLNKAGFNGMYRENSRGEFNIPFGKRQRINLFDSDNLAAVSEALRKVQILESSYEQTVRDAKAGDVVYFDPPYVPMTATSSFTSYTSEGFGKDDQIALRDLALKLTERKVLVVLSNSSAGFVDDLYKDFKRDDPTAKRNISASSKGRSPVKELIFTNSEMFEL